MATKANNLPVDYEPTFSSAALTAQMEAELSPEDTKTMKLISMLVGKDGLKLEEACKVANIEIESLKMMIEKHPIISKIISIKESEYKHMLLKQMSVRARSGDDKVAQWLLETRFPDEFGDKKKKGGAENGMDVIAQAISYIQENGDNAPVIKKTSTLMSIRQVKPTDSPEVKALKTFLN